MQLAKLDKIILDEPTNYLDIKATEALEKALANTVKTMIMVCHDRKFIENICDYIFEIKDKCINEFDGSYEEYYKEKNKPKINKAEKENKEKLMLLKNKISVVISLLSIETDILKKEKLDYEYCNLLKEISKLKN